MLILNNHNSAVSKIREIVATRKSQVVLEDFNPKIA